MTLYEGAEGWDPPSKSSRRTAATVPREPNRQSDSSNCNYDPAKHGDHRIWPSSFGDAQKREVYIREQAEIHRAGHRLNVEAHRAHLIRLAIYGTAPAVVATAVGLVLDMEALAAVAFGVFGLLVAVALFRSRV